MEIKQLLQPQLPRDKDKANKAKDTSTTKTNRTKVKR